LQQKTKRLLGDVFLRKARLLFGDATNRPMQHWQENENENTLNECGIAFAGREEFAEQLIGSRVRSRRSQMQQPN
jgi:hypothetical protein